MTDRVIVYAGAGVQDSDLLRMQIYARRALGFFSRLVNGPAAVAHGFVPTVSGWTLTLSSGVIVTPPQNEDTMPFGSQPASVHQVPAINVSLDPTVLANIFSGTVAGQANLYVVYAVPASTDTDLVTFYYQNTANPTQVFRGVNNNGVAQASTRLDSNVIGAIGAVSPVSAPVFPAIPAGAIPLYRVTVAAGDTGLVLAQIVKDPAAPFLALTLPGVSADVASVLSYAGLTPDNTGQLLAALQARFVQTTGGPSNLVAGGHQIYAGWTGTALEGGVDTTDLGAFAFQQWVTAGFQPKGSYVTGGPYQAAGSYQPAGSYVTQNFGTFVSYTANGSFTVPAGVTRIYFEGIGGGGGGGSSLANAYSGGGGGAGGFVRGFAPVTPGQVLSLVVGGGGVSATAGTGATAGGTTTVAGCTAYGGGGGGSANPDSAGGAGGTSTILTGQNAFSITGGDGHDGQSSSTTTALNGLVLFGGDGGGSYYGGGGRAGTAYGTNGKAYGAGGGGGYLTTATGGSGGNGLVLIAY